jgi:outer membrane protein OmpU
MNNFKKIGLSALAGSLATVSAHAVDIEVTGDAILTWMSAEGNQAGSTASNGKGIGMDSDLYFNASGELDNGWTVSVFTALNTDATITNSSSQMTIGMGSLGTVMVADVAAGSSANGIDDISPNAYEESWDNTTGTANIQGFGDNTTAGAVEYRTPALDFMGASISATYAYDPAANVAAPSAGAVADGAQSGDAGTVKVTYEGLTLGAGYEAVSDDGTTTGEKGGTAYAKYSMGPITASYQETHINSASGGADIIGDIMGVSYTAGDITISYSQLTEQTSAIASTAALEEEEFSTTQIAYSMGAMAIRAALFESDNLDGVAGAKYEATELSVSFSF